MLLLFLHYPPDDKCLDGQIASRWHTTQSYLYEKLSTPQPSLGEIPGEDCRLLSTIRCEWWNRASATDDAAEATDDFFIFTFLLLNQEHSVNNECSQSIQSVRHSKQTHHMWPRQKDHSMWKEKRRKRKVFLAHSAPLAVHTWRSDTVTDQRFSTAASILKSWTYICQ